MMIGLEKSVSEINAANLPRLSWMRVIAGGAIWAAVYNLVWGLAWFAFIRREWREAFAAINRPLLFTADIWIFWIALTLPIGVAIAAYAGSLARSVSAPKATVYAGITLWLVMTVGMATWSWQNSLSIRIISLDAVVNLVAMMVPALFAGLTRFNALDNLTVLVSSPLNGGLRPSSEAAFTRLHGGESPTSRPQKGVPK